MGAFKFLLCSVIYAIIVYTMKFSMKAKNTVFVGIVLPFFAFAQAASNIEDQLANLNTILHDQLIPMLIVLATVVFMVGILRYVAAGGDEEKVKAGRNMMIFGVIALTVMVSMWGIAKILVETFDVGGQPIPANLGGL